MGAFSLRTIIYIIDLLTRAHLRFAAELPCLCLTSETASLFSGFFTCHDVVFVWTRRNLSFNIAPKTPGIEH